VNFISGQLKPIPFLMMISTARMDSSTNKGNICFDYNEEFLIKWGRLFPLVEQLKLGQNWFCHPNG